MSLLTASKIANLSVALLGRSVILPRTVTRVPGGEYQGPSGGTVTLRVRVPRDARIQTTPGDPIVFDGIDETSVPVVLSHLYNATTLTDEDLALGLEVFGEQIAAPMVAAIARGAEDQVAAVMNTLTAETGFDDVTDVDEALLEARQQLGRAGVPAGDRWLAVSPEFATELLGPIDEQNSADPSAASALADAIITRRRGFVVVESPALDAGTAVAYHMSAFAMGLRAPSPAAGADSSVASSDGIALRVARAFDITRLSESVAASTFAGAALVEDHDGGSGTEVTRAIKLELASS